MNHVPQKRAENILNHEEHRKKQKRIFEPQIKADEKRMTQIKQKAKAVDSRSGSGMPIPAISEDADSYCRVRRVPQAPGGSTFSVYNRKGAESVPFLSASRVR